MADGSHHHPRVCAQIDYSYFPITIIISSSPSVLHDIVKLDYFEHLVSNYAYLVDHHRSGFRTRKKKARNHNYHTNVINTNTNATATAPPLPEIEGIANANHDFKKPCVHYSPVPASNPPANKLRMSPSLADAAMARLNHRTKMLTRGDDKVFQQTFGDVIIGEKLLHSYACYLSTSIGPVVLQLNQLRSVNPSANRWNPSEKYIHIATRDGHDFWFIGFIHYDNALMNLSQVLVDLHKPK